MPDGEVGWSAPSSKQAAEDDALLAGAPGALDVLEWHSYSCTPPEGAAILARSEACVQAFRVGTTTWGLQFHVEVTRPILEDWARAGRGRAGRARRRARSSWWAPTSSVPTSYVWRSASATASRAQCLPLPSPPRCPA